VLLAAEEQLLVLLAAEEQLLVLHAQCRRQDQTEQSWSTHSSHRSGGRQCGR
jgi:hypothetical protein